MGYRKIWEKTYGQIPKDEFGRTYEIHHIDGNRENNDISNLKCLPLQEHYDLHLSQGDYAAAFRIAQRMSISVEEKSRLMSLSNKKRLEAKNHPFLDPEVRTKARQGVAEQLKNRTHPFLNRRKEWQEQANKTYAQNHNRSEVVKKSWEAYKTSNPGNKRTIAGAKAGAERTKGTKWFHKLDGTHLRATENDPRVKLEDWIPGRFNPNLKNINN